MWKPGHSRPTSRAAREHGGRGKPGRKSLGLQVFETRLLAWRREDVFHAVILNFLHQSLIQGRQAGLFCFCFFPTRLKTFIRSSSIDLLPISFVQTNETRRDVPGFDSFDCDSSLPLQERRWHLYAFCLSEQKQSRVKFSPLFCQEASLNDEKFTLTNDDER